MDFSSASVMPGTDCSRATRLFTVGSGFCTMIVCVMLASFTMLTTGAAAAWPPGQMVPVLHFTHGLVPGEDPWLEYPGLQVQLFCANDIGGDMLLYGHVFCTPSRHQYPRAHGAQAGPPYWLSHTHGQMGLYDFMGYVAWLGALVHEGHTRLRVARQETDS